VIHFYNSGDPIWIPSDCILYQPDAHNPRSYKLLEKPICAWYIEQADSNWSKIWYENSFWTIKTNAIYPYKEQTK
jgi:hypothetical protein